MTREELNYLLELYPVAHFHRKVRDLMGKPSKTVTRPTRPYIPPAKPPPRRN